MDVEDLVTFGRSNTVCPYYLAKQAVADAEIVFLPYNYLIDPLVRAVHDLDLHRSVVIFDEAHNLESSCGEAVSFDLTTTDLDACVAEAQQCLDRASNPNGLGSTGGRSRKEFATLISKPCRVTLRLELNPILLRASGRDQGRIRKGSTAGRLYRQGRRCHLQPV